MSPRSRATWVAWAWTLIAFRDHPALPGAALLAYGFGLWHAVDANHIAAIDNVPQADASRPAADAAAQAGGAHLNEIGFARVALLVATWIGSVAALRYKRFGAVELERRS